MKERESFAQSAFLLTVVGVFTQVVGFFYRMMLSRTVGAENMGLYQLVMPVYGVLQSVAVSGLAVAVCNRTAAEAARQNSRGAARLLHTALWLLFAVWAALAVAVVLLAQPLASRVLGDGRTALALPCLLPCLLLTGVENLTKNYFYGFGETRIPAAVELAEQVIRAAAVLGLLWMLMPLDGAHTVAVIVLGMGVSEVFSSLVLTLVRRAQQRRLNPRPQQTGEAGSPRRALLRIALPVGFTALLGNLMGSVNAILVPQLLVLAGYTASGAMEAFGVVFGMTLPLLNLPFAFVNALSLSVLPRLTECCTLGRKAELNRYIETALFSVSLLVLPLMALLVTLGGDVGALLFHDSRVGELLLPLSFGAALSAYEAVLGTVLNGVGRQKQGAAISLFCGGVQLGCTLLLTGRLGFYAYALGTAVSSLLGFWLRVRVVVRQAGAEIRWFSVLTAPALSALLMGLTVNLLYRSLRGSGEGLWSATLLAALVGCALYLAALLAQGVNPLGLPAQDSHSLNAPHSSRQRKRSS
ncbi:MAG: oligosaccharide flippase family protein [Clostridiales bacterium]|nr:oligosaccharide flippase family protein [Clostridiales bacterium]